MLTWSNANIADTLLYFTSLLSTAYTTWGIAGRKRRLSAAHQYAWAGGVLHKDTWGIAGRKRRLSAAHQNCLSRRYIISRQCLFDFVNPGLPGAPSCFAATESCVVCTLSWVVYWQSCEMSKPFNPLLLNMMVYALCSYHVSDFGVGNYVSSGLVHSFP